MSNVVVTPLFVAALDYCVLIINSVLLRFRAMTGRVYHFPASLFIVVLFLPAVFGFQRSVEGREANPLSVVVTSLNDSQQPSRDGLVTLRQAIASAGLGTTITFDYSLAGGTITLDGSELKIDRGITIDASSIGGITIDADGKSRVFDIRGVEGYSVKLIGLTIKGGKIVGDGVDNSNSRGTMSFENRADDPQNTEQDGGGGIYLGFGVPLILINTIVSGNSAELGGGIYLAGLSKPLIVNSTISGNSADISGGGVYATSSAEASIVNSIITFNHSESEKDFRGGDVVFGSNNIIGDDPDFAVAPIFESGKLVNADKLDFSLKPGSCAIDRGKLTVVETRTDIVGRPRIFPAWKDSAAVDIGAYEYQKRDNRDGLESPSAVVNTTNDILDDTDDVISLRDAISYVTEGDTITFDESLSGKTITLNGSELKITEGITIDAGSIGGITIDAGGESRVFNLRKNDFRKPVDNKAVFNRSGRVIERDLRKAEGNKVPCRPVILSNLKIIGGKEKEDGGGIYSIGGLILRNSTVSGNVSDASGGGIFNVDGDLKIFNSIISGNSAGLFGGGIRDEYDSTMLINSVVSENRADESYGGVVSGSIRMTNSTVTGNVARGSVGGLSGDLIMTNSIVAFNYAKIDRDIDVGTREPFVAKYCIIGGDPGFKAGPIIKSGELVNLGELDLSLKENSPAIDAGMNGAVETETDLSGNPRIADGVVDIGAFEFQGNRGAEELPRDSVGE